MDRNLGQLTYKIQRYSLYLIFIRSMSIPFIKNIKILFSGKVYQAQYQNMIQTTDAEYKLEEKTSKKINLNRNKY